MDATFDRERLVAGADSVLGVVERTLERFLASAGVDRVYGEPLREGDRTVIPAAEVLTVLGFGSGFGMGSGPAEPARAASPAEDGEAQTAGGGGVGGGGGGRTLARPVAIVVVGPEGVRVEPVVDPTKIALAGLTAAGFMAAVLLGMLGPKNLLRQLKGE
jgi:uncharacterized spore protein YtfJ